MEFIAFLCLIAFAALALIGHKQIARRNFRRSIATYELARLKRIAEGDHPSSIPTVEEFLAARDELHLLAEIDRAKQPASQNRHASIHDQHELNWTITDEMSVSSQSDDDFDDDYQIFVDEMWSHEGISLDGFILHRRTRDGDKACVLHSLVEGTQKRIYLNLYEDDERKTYAADSRHKWFVKKRLFRDVEVDYSAFIGIKGGADPMVALGESVYPRTAEQASSIEFDRFQTSDKKYVIGYRSTKGLSYRTISRVIRYSDRFSARCHFRWGERRTFLNHGLVSVLDTQTNQVVDNDAFLKKRK